MRSFIRLIMLSALACGILASCAKKTNTAPLNAANPQATCSSNPFLQRYGCSVDRVEVDAEKGNADAQYTLGYMYFYGIGTIKDEDTAIYWIRKAANQGQPQAQAALNMIQTKQFPKKANAQMTTQTEPKKPDYQSLARKKPDNYSIQLMGSHHPEALRAFAIEEDITHQSKTIETALNNQDWYVLLYGQYDNEKAAESALATLPKDLQALHPWVRATDALERG